MKPINLGNVAAEYDEEPLVKAPTLEYPGGYGIHIRFKTAKELRKALKTSRSKLGYLSDEVGILKLTTETSDFNMRGVVSGAPLKDLPRWSLPLHVDLRGEVSHEEQIKNRFTAAFAPELWASRPQVLWQNASSSGRPASTVWVPSSVGSETMLDLLTTPHYKLVDIGFLHKDEICLWDKICSLTFAGLNKVGMDPTAQLMLFEDLYNMISMSRATAKLKYLRLFERATEHVLTEVEPWSLEMNWQSAEALGGAVCISSNKGQKLVHARRNRGKHMGRPTVKGASS